MKKLVIAAALFALATVSPAAQDAAKGQKFGAGVTLTEAVDLKDLYAAPAKFVGKTIRVDGTVTDVCTEMGCWMAIEQEKGFIVRLKVEDGDIVFPVAAKGKKVSAEGVFESIKASDKDGVSAANEQKPTGTNADTFGKTFHLKGLGAYVY